MHKKLLVCSMLMIVMGSIEASSCNAQTFDTPDGDTSVESVMQELLSLLSGSGYDLRLRGKRSYSEGVDEPLLRISPPSVEGFSGPNPRLISNLMCYQHEDQINLTGHSDAVWAWGQFLDHDISLTETSATNGIAIIPVLETEDSLFPVIPFTRSNFVTVDGQRQQINQISHFIDASNVYGSDKTRASRLRGPNGTMRTSANELLPFEGAEFFAGDIRANENLVLSSLHTLFVREHNRLAARIAKYSPDATSNEIYHLARKIVGAEIQIITYNEFLPTLLGRASPRLQDYQYKKRIDPRIANEFSSALYRVGHSMLSGDIILGDLGIIPLRDAFFNPQVLVDNPEYVDLLLAGLNKQPHQEVDTHLVEDVRSFLFGAPGQGGMDLACLNIQRGRDHDLPDYNTVRQSYGLPPVSSFSEITTNTESQQALKEMYGSVDNIDLWVGALAEDHAPGSQVGRLIRRAMVDQFTRLRDGDPFFHTNDPDLKQIVARRVINLDRVSLGWVIRKNTTSLVPNNMFVVQPQADDLTAQAMMSEILSMMSDLFGS